MTGPPPPVPSHRYTTCATCTNEVLVDFYHEGPAQCEYCSGAVKPIHQQFREERPVVDHTAVADNVAFLERVDAVLTRALPRPDRPAAFGRCPDCKLAYVLIGERIVHPGTCLAAIGGKRDHD